MSAADPRIKAAIYLCPPLNVARIVPGKTYAQIKIPGLLLTGTEDSNRAVKLRWVSISEPESARFSTSLSRFEAGLAADLIFGRLFMRLLPWSISLKKRKIVLETVP
ncbi:MAG: hypothetical protein KGS72_06885 [Cyanobacteria bacterium REEB67]|nr:hypothetical protein [Cyanobacteria bacterium REEB67]